MCLKPIPVYYSHDPIRFTQMIAVATVAPRGGGTSGKSGRHQFFWAEIGNRSALGRIFSL